MLPHHVEMSIERPSFVALIISNASSLARSWDLDFPSAITMTYKTTRDPGEGANRPVVHLVQYECSQFLDVHKHSFDIRLYRLPFILTRPPPAAAPA